MTSRFCIRTPHQSHCTSERATDNIFSAFDLENNAFIGSGHWIKCIQLTYSFVNGQLQMVFVPNTNYVGPIGFTVVVSSSSIWNYSQFVSLRFTEYTSPSATR